MSFLGIQRSTPVHDAVLVVTNVVVLTVGAVAMLNVALTSKTRVLQGWSMMYIFAILCAVSLAFAGWIDRDSLLQVVPNVAAVGAVGGLWCGSLAFNGRRPRILVVGVFLLVTGVVTALELPEYGEWAGDPLAMAALILLACVSARESVRGDLATLLNGRVIAVVCILGAAWTTARLLAYAIGGHESPIFLLQFNPTRTVAIALIAYVAVAFTTAMLAASRTGSGALRGTPSPTFSMGVLDWAAFVPGASDRIARVRAHGEHSAVMVVHINGLEEINVTYGPAFGDDTIRTLADFLRQELHPTTIIGHRGGGRFVLVGIAADPQETERRALELLNALIGVTVSGKKGFRLAVSIGTSDSFTEEHTFDALYRAARAACDRARAAGGSRVETAAAVDV
jgi:diguanylate cyclase (GGDEF)-like protein